MKPQVIERDGKPLFAVVPWKEWLRLSRLADLAETTDEALFREGMASLAAGEETFPLELVTRLDAEHPVKVFRDHREMTQADLAKAAGIVPAYLAQIEQGVRRGSPATLRKLADALRVNIDFLVPRTGAPTKPARKRPASPRRNRRR
jgi:DNA-binding XRE family transcriptional regulator